MFIAGFDDNLLSKQTNPALTTVAQNYMERAKLSVELLEKMQRKEEVFHEYSLELELISHGTTSSYNGA
ncbi:substrate-binding domain-containing protein [Treponema peruense]|uniref:Substrate-binding domain-containing protein n=1 Tax=Treponema peruense TaxID=2787628 RepID=A0A7T3V648_9SPIR|nr:substrate-binding domain-containing protein [uncultured Treponema sp.]QQA02188.1 substrate-binding domain-containing protein [Treponema peruense]